MRLAVLCLMLIGLPYAATSDTGMLEFRGAITTLWQNVENKHRRWGVISEPLTFDRMRSGDAYQNFATVVSNDWSYIVSHLNVLATNEWERLVTLGVGKSFDEDFYIAASTDGVDLKSQGALSSTELVFMLVSSRTNIASCIARRFQDPAVTNLVTKLRIEFPDDEYWNSVLTGGEYSNRISTTHNEL